MSDSLKAEAAAKRHGIEVLNGEVEKLEGTLAVVKADRDNMIEEANAIEAYLRTRKGSAK